jgi:hypothetical protein
MAPWSANTKKSGRLSRALTLGLGLDHLLWDQFYAPCSKKFSNDLNQLGKVIKPLSINLFNALSSFSLQILEVKTCSDSRLPRGQYIIQMTGSAITVVREVILLVLAPNHVTASI